MQSIIIDSEFKALLPPLSIETYEALEDNIITNGCMFPLVTWEGILIDGHNRYSICTKYDIAYEVIEKEFASREDVIIWIIGNQVARRNLTPMQMTYFRGLHYNTVKSKRGNKTGRNQFSEEKGNYYTFPQEIITAESLSKQYKVSRKTIFTDSKVSKAIDAIGMASVDAKVKILSGDVSVDKKDLQRLVAAPDYEIAEIAAQMETGTYGKKPVFLKVSDRPNPLTIVAENSGTQNPGMAAAVDIAFAAINSDNPLLGTITGPAFQDMINACAAGTAARTKTALRTYIDTLEDIYAGL